MNTKPTNHFRILIVDDEPTLRLGFRFALTTENYAVETASNGLLALEAIENHHFDAIVLDLRMPQMDGLETLSELRSRGLSIPVILCSAHITPSRAMEALKLRCFDFLSKPVNPLELRKGVGRVLMSDPEGTMDQVLHNLRHGQFTEARKKADASNGTPPEQRAFWRRLIADLEESPTLDVNAYLKEYGHDLIPLLTFEGE
jgi:DNA-binding NtrC family response regulator